MIYILEEDTLHSTQAAQAAADLGVYWGEVLEPIPCGNPRTAVLGLVLLLLERHSCNAVYQGLGSLNLTESPESWVS